jgi:predicted extracellular nuclease
MNTSGLTKRNFLACASSAIIGSMAFSSHAAIIINEIDYDQPGTDTAEFIELFNSGSSAISLNNYSIDLINGNNLSTYRSIDLSGFNISANSYFVVCSDSNQVANCDYSFTTTNGWFQNGAPDAVALYESTSLLDSLSYEGSLTPFTEGDFMTINDSNSDILSLARITDGIDSNNNALDFQLGCITPGSANIAGVGDCSVPSVSAVPLPAAAWLFGSGLIGLIGLARRK